MGARTRTEVTFRITPLIEGRPVRDGETKLDAIRVEREQAIYPLNARGDVQWQRAERTTTATFEVKVGEVGKLMAALADELAYFATGAEN